IGHAGISCADDCADNSVGVDDRLVRIETGLMATIVDRFPPRISKGQAPVNTFRWCHFEDESLIRSELPASDYRLVLRRCAYRGAVNGRQEAVRWRRLAEPQKEIEVVVDEIAEGDQLPRYHDVSIDDRQFRRCVIADSLDS